jgi:SAM-dependent methyltransferase
MDQTDYFTILRAAVTLRRQRVLEVGGAVPPAMIAPTGVDVWTSVDISPNRFRESLGAEELPAWYETHLLSVTSLPFPDESYDVVYSTNCFEHVDDIAAAFGEVYRVLKPGGILFTIFSPIWSGPVGHHTWVWDGDTPLTFQQGVFPDWHHLACTESELRPYLETKYEPELVEKILGYVYRSRDINRRLDSDYERETARYDFAKILALRLRSRREPDRELRPVLQRRYAEVRDFRTLGYFWILAKQKTTLGARLHAYLGGGLAVVRCKLRAPSHREKP